MQGTVGRSVSVGHVNSPRRRVARFERQWDSNRLLAFPYGYPLTSPLRGITIDIPLRGEVRGYLWGGARESGGICGLKSFPATRHVPRESVHVILEEAVKCEIQFLHPFDLSYCFHLQKRLKLPE
jgi:hypothetical protein